MAISIKGMNKARVLAALYNASTPLGMGFLRAKAEPMTEAQAAELLKTGSYFDYLHGRAMKVDLSGDELDERLYDRDLGQGAAADAIAQVKAAA
jgi:hypothetical protein